MPPKTVRYAVDAAKSLRRHSNMAARIREAVCAFVEEDAHANNVTKLVGVSAWRMRVGDVQGLFESDDDEIVVTKVGPRGGVYD